MKVLLVEPDAALRRSLASFLLDTGAVVLQAGNVSEALELAISIENCDMLIINHILDQSMSGFDLAGRIRESRPLAPLILMCDQSRPTPVFSIGPNDRLLPMPFGVDRLLLLMRQMAQVDRGISTGSSETMNEGDGQAYREPIWLAGNGEDRVRLSWLPRFRR
jgi:DNA-binding response OmpR family regulator